MEPVGTTISCRFVAPTVLVFVVLLIGFHQTTASQNLPPGIRWTSEIPAAPSTLPVIAGDRVFVSSLPGLLLSYDMKDGREAWREPITPDQSVVVSGDRVIVAAGESVQAMLISDRSVVWRAPTGTVTAPLIVKDGWVIAASANRLHALREADGSVVWQRDAALQRDRATIDGNTLIVPLANGRLQALDLVNGTPRWEKQFGGSLTEPLVLGNRLYVGGTDKQFYCLNIANGDTEWQRHVGAQVRGRASTDGRRVFYVGLDNLVRAVNAGNGELKWQQGVRFRPFAGPVVAGSSVFLAGPTPVVRVFQASDGKDGGTVTFPEPLVTAPAVGTLANGEVVVAGVTGSLTESWKLWLASPPAAQGGQVSAMPPR